jgi:hypothetical protein
MPEQTLARSRLSAAKLAVSRAGIFDAARGGSAIEHGLKSCARLARLYVIVAGNTRPSWSDKLKSNLIRRFVIAARTANRTAKRLGPLLVFLGLDPNELRAIAQVVIHHSRSLLYVLRPPVGVHVTLNAACSRTCQVDVGARRNWRLGLYADRGPSWRGRRGHPWATGLSFRPMFHTSTLTARGRVDHFGYGSPSTGETPDLFGLTESR